VDRIWDYPVKKKKNSILNALPDRACDTLHPFKFRVILPFYAEPAPPNCLLGLLKIKKSP
jgi:hypothetical protein